MTSDRTGLRESYPASWRWLRIARRIDGWLTDAEGNALFELARRRAPERNAVVVELGSWQGKSSVLLAAGLCGKQNPGLFCVDPFGKDENPRYQEIYEPLISSMRLTLEEAFRRNIRRCGLGQIVQPIKAYSFDAVRGWHKPVDLLFIDASHDYESVHRDLLLWSRFVKVNAVVVLHDVSASWEGPSRVMAEDLQPPYFGGLEKVDSLLWATKTSVDPLPEHPHVTITAVPKVDFDARQREIARLLADRNEPDGKLKLEQVESSQLGEELKRAQTENSQLGEELRRAQAEIGPLEEKLRNTERELVAMRRSLTWRITEPVRRWAGWLRDLSADRRTVLLLRSSGLFDRDYYLAQNPDVAAARLDPVRHYVRYGAAEGRNPSRFFETLAYVENHPELNHTGMNPLLHYALHGSNRKPAGREGGEDDH